MLPEKVFPINYQDYGILVENHLKDILTYQDTNNIKFDFVLGKLRNGLFAASIIANNLHINMGTIDISLDKEILKENFYFPLDINKKSDIKINILFVDSICNTGETVKKVKVFFHKFYPNINIVSYCTLLSENALILPDIKGLTVDKYIQTPWERSSFTPQSHLDRLESGKDKSIIEDYLCIGICSEECKDDIYNILPENNKKRWYITFNNEDDQIRTSSGISSHSVPSNITLKQAQTKYKVIIDEKIKFIEDNGLTHFIENNLEQAILLANRSPVCHIIYLSEIYFYKINAKELDKLNLFI